MSYPDIYLNPVQLKDGDETTQFASYNQRLTDILRDIYDKLNDLSDNGSGDMSYSDTRIKASSFTRDISLTGNQSITGVGFQPSIVLLFASASAGSVVGATSWGWGDGTAKFCISSVAAAGIYHAYTAFAVVLTTAAGVYSGVSATSMDSDGFTLTWTKGGLPTGTATIGFIAFR